MSPGAGPVLFELNIKLDAPLDLVPIVPKRWRGVRSCGRGPGRPAAARAPALLRPTAADPAVSSRRRCGMLQAPGVVPQRLADHALPGHAPARGELRQPRKPLRGGLELDG